jgi:4-amino-4-deoxy-L-arabinose transferase-like glycosyltransferase
MFEESSAAPGWMQSESRGRRCLVYAILLMALAAGDFFTNIGEPTMSVDEAQYALCVDHCRQTHNWLEVTPYPPEPYYQKPPMYVWLTGFTYRLFGEGMVRYRFWSALFGIGCVGLTCVVGAMLLSAEVGLLGGLLLLTNRYFQGDHGARTGSLDTSVTFCALVCIVFYWLWHQGRARGWAWAGIGAAAGLACLFKPIAGVPILIILGLHAALRPRKTQSAVGPVKGLILACAVAAAVVSPYYVAVVSRAGTRVFKESIQRAIIQTAMHGDPNTHEHMFRNAFADPLAERRTGGRPWHFLVTELHHSAPAFGLSGIAFAFVLAVALRGTNRSAFTLLALVTVVYLFIFSMSSVRRIWYTYPAFPAVALSIAAFATWALGAALARARQNPAGPLFATGVLGLLCGVLLIEAMRFGANQLGSEQCDYVPWNTYGILKPAIRDGRMRLVFYGFPKTQFEWRRQMGLDASDCLYLEHMREASHLDDPAKLRLLLEEHKPTLLLLSKFVDSDRLESDLKLDDRSDDRFVFEHRAFRLRGIDMDPLLAPRLAPGIPCPGLELRALNGDPIAESGSKALATTGSFIVRVAPPLREDGWLTVRLARPDDASTLPDRFDACLGERLLAWESINPLAREFKITVPIKHGRWTAGHTDVIIYLHPAISSPTNRPVMAKVTEVSLSLFPEAAVSP